MKNKLKTQLINRAAAIMLLGAFGFALSACSFIVRDPDQYRDDTGKLLDAQAGQIKTCYDAIIKDDAKAVGTVQVSFKVASETGMIGDVKADESASTAPPAVQQCVVEALVGQKLDPPDARDGKATFAYEFTVAPQKTSKQPAKKSGFETS